MNIFSKLRQRIWPKQRYHVEVLVHNLDSDKSIGRLVVTTDARSKAGARKNVHTFLRLITGKVEVIKQPLNGVQKNG